MTSVRIRPATPTDGDTFRELALACPPLDIHTPYTYWVQATYFSQQCFIAELHGDPVGFLTSVSNGDDILVWQIGVVAAARGQGIGRQLVAAIAAWSRGKGATNFHVTVDPDNVASQELFRQCAAESNGQLVHTGELDLRDSTDPLFRETEHIFSFELGA